MTQQPTRLTHAAPPSGRGESRRSAEETQILSMDEVIARYPDQWIVMRVTGSGQHNVPREGQIVARAPSFAEGSRLLTQCQARADPPGSRYHLFLAQRHPLPGDQLRQRIAELMTQGDPPGRWPGLR
jgi:hypothetical protein